MNLTWPFYWNINQHSQWIFPTRTHNPLNTTLRNNMWLKHIIEKQHAAQRYYTQSHNPKEFKQSRVPYKTAFQKLFTGVKLGLLTSWPSSLTSLSHSHWRLVPLLEGRTVNITQTIKSRHKPTLCSAGEHPAHIRDQLVRQQTTQALPRGNHQLQLAMIKLGHAKDRSSDQHNPANTVAS